MVAPTPRVAIIHKFAMQPVRISSEAGVLDRAPILLGSRRNFTDIGNQPVAIAAIDAIQLLYRVQIGQQVAVKHDVVRAFHLGNAVDRKADGLKNRDKQIQKDERHDQGIDEWCRQNHR